MGGVQDLRAGFLRRGGALLLHTGTNRLHLCLRVDGCLCAGADCVRLSLCVRTLTLKSDEHGAFAGGAVQAGGEDFVVVLAGAGVMVGCVAVCAAYYARSRVGGGTERQGGQPEGEPQGECAAAACQLLEATRLCVPGCSCRGSFREGCH